MLDYLYYTLFKISSLREHTWGEAGGMQHWSAKVLLSIIVGINLLTIYVLVNQLVEINIKLTKFHAAFLTLVIYILFYLRYIKNRRYALIVERFDAKPKLVRYTLNTLSILYMVFSVVILFVVLEAFKVDNV